LKILLAIKSLSSVSALFILIGISILVAGGFLLAFLWSVGNGQYDDDYTPSVRMLFDQETETAPSEAISTK
jgi:cbb3-type cytochrome oxidase maturation protein